MPQAAQSWSQENRRIAIALPEAVNKFMLRRYSMHEEIGRPFVCEVELVSPSGAVDPAAVIGQNATIRIDMGGQKTRFINGFISRFAQVSGGGGGSEREYRATLVPWLWFLSQSTDCCFYPDKTVPEILTDVFSEWGFSELVDNQITGTYLPSPFTVQYRESTLNFISRLMEQEGIYYFFKHENGKHKVVLTDAPSAHVVVEGYAEVPFREEAGLTAQVFSEWTTERRIVPGKHVLRDFDYLVPTKDLQLERAAEGRSHDHAAYEVFDYPGGYIERDAGTSLSTVRNQEHGIHYDVVHCVHRARGLAVGTRFTPKPAPTAAQEVEHIILAQNIEGFEAINRKSGDPEDDIFVARGTAVKATVPIRPERRTPKPLISGPQTAIVVASSEEEILTDEYGRVKVKFHWDRWSEANENASCWIRVAQMWAGKKWGAVFLPRKGQEVVVEFLEGDPDKPIITGSVYNGGNMPPYALPGFKTMSTIKSSSSKGGEGFNELRFEDKKDSEQVFLHAQKDLEIRVLNDRHEYIGNDRHLIVERDRIEEIRRDRHEKVTRDHCEEITRDRNIKVSGKQATEIVDSLSLKVSGDVIEVFEANQSTTVSADHYLKADNIVIEGMTNITIKVGDSFIAIESGSITVSTGEFNLETTSGNAEVTSAAEIVATATSNVTMAADGNIGVAAGGSAEFSGLTASVSGDSSVEIKGASIAIG